MADGYLLSEGDLKLLQALLKRERARPSQGVRSRHWYEPDGNAPETYIALIPSGGLPGRSGTTPGSAECAIYQLVEGVLTVVTGLERTVYNLATDAIDAGAYVPVTRDKYGKWLVTGTVAGEAGTGTAPEDYIDVVTEVCLIASVVDTGTGTGTGVPIPEGPP